jgi:hypothetical protein
MGGISTSPGKIATPANSNVYSDARDSRGTRAISVALAQAAPGDSRASMCGTRERRADGRRVPSGRGGYECYRDVSSTTRQSHVSQVKDVHTYKGSCAPRTHAGTTHRMYNFAGSHATEGKHHMEDKQMQAAFARHWASFLEEVNATDDTPENRKKIQTAIEAVLGDNRKATGLGAALAQHWEPFISKLLSGIDSETKKQELVAAFQEMLLEQVMKFSRILSSS